MNEIAKTGSAAASRYGRTRERRRPISPPDPVHADVDVVVVPGRLPEELEAVGAADEVDDAGVARHPERGGDVAGGVVGVAARVGHRAAGRVEVDRVGGLRADPVV
jgi:hypothetical protein